jgi:hypothetical protein
VIYDQPHNRKADGLRMSWDKLDQFIEFLETFGSLD